MTPLETCSLAQAAAAAGYSIDRFRKIWRDLPAFPAPIRTPAANGKGAYAWRAASIEAWQLAREKALGTVRQPAPANDEHGPRQVHGRALRLQQASLDRMMERA